MRDRPSSERLRQGLILLAGAIVFVLVVGAGPRRFYLVPLGIGLVYLASAAAGGRKGAYWATAVVLVGWGAAVAFAHDARPDLDIAGLYLVGAGAGATAGAVLARRGFAVDPLGAAATIALGGLLLALQGRWDPFADARTYAALVGAVGLVNVLAGVRSAR